MSSTNSKIKKSSKKEISRKIKFFWIFIGFILMINMGFFIFYKSPSQIKYDSSKIIVLNQKKYVQIIDKNFNLKYQLPVNWKISERMVKNRPWSVAFSSNDLSQALRFGFKENHKKPLIYFVADYVRKRVRAKSKKGIQNIISSIKAITDREKKYYNVDSGFVAHFTLPNPNDRKTTRENITFWKREHIIALQKDKFIFLFSFVARNNFFPEATAIKKSKKEKQNFFKNFSSLKNPLYVTSLSIRFLID